MTEPESDATAGRYVLSPTRRVVGARGFCVNHPAVRSAFVTDDGVDRCVACYIKYLHRLLDSERARANEAARLSAEARDSADELRKTIAAQAEQIELLEGDR